MNEGYIFFNLIVLAYFASALLYTVLALEIFRLKRQIARAIGILLLAEASHNFMQTIRYIIYDGANVPAWFILLSQFLPLAGVVFVFIALGRDFRGMENGEHTGK